MEDKLHHDPDLPCINYVFDPIASRIIIECI